MKKNTVLYIIITILLIIIAVGITYIIMDKNDINNNPNENNNQVKVEEENKEELKDGVTLKDTYQENDTIIQEYEIILNGKKANVQIKFVNSYNETFEEYAISGIFDKEEVYGNISQRYNFTIDNINHQFNENNFEIIKGSDNKNYLAVIANKAYYDTLYVYNDELELLTKSFSENGCTGKMDGFIISYAYNIPEIKDNTIWYEDLWNILPNNIYGGNVHVKIEDNEIYDLRPIIDFESNENYGVIEERVYTIKDNKFTYKVINTYEILNVLNQC